MGGGCFVPVPVAAAVVVGNLELVLIVVTDAVTVVVVDLDGVAGVDCDGSGGGLVAFRVEAATVEAVEDAADAGGVFHSAPTPGPNFPTAGLLILMDGVK